MRKVLIGFLIILFSTGAAFSVEKMPADLKAVTDKITKITVNYYKSVGKVKSGKELAAVIDKYTSELEKLAPQIKALEAKYGDAEDNSDSDELKTVTDYEAFQGEWAKQMAGAEFGDAIIVIQKYYTDPAVQKALERQSKVMEDIGISDDNEDSDRDDSNESDNGDE